MSSTLQQLAAAVRGLADEAGQPMQVLAHLQQRARQLAAQADALGHDGGTVTQRLSELDASLGAVSESMATVRADAQRFAAFLAHGGGGSGGADDGAGRGHALPPRPFPAQAVGSGADRFDIAFKSTEGRPLFGPGGIDPHAPAQGRLGDCYLIAALIAMADRDPAALAAAISMDPSNTGAAVVGGVRVDTRLPYRVGDPDQGDILGTTTDGSTWVGLVEKAWVRRAGGTSYSDIEGGQAEEVMAWLSGKDGQRYTLAELERTRVHDLIAGDQPLVASSFSPASFIADPVNGQRMSELYARYDLVGPHAYVVKGFDSQGRVLLRNPWGEGPGDRVPPPIPFDDFVELFRFLRTY